MSLIDDILLKLNKGEKSYLFKNLKPQPSMQSYKKTNQHYLELRKEIFETTLNQLREMHMRQSQMMKDARNRYEIQQSVALGGVGGRDIISVNRQNTQQFNNLNQSFGDQVSTITKPYSIKQEVTYQYKDKKDIIGKKIIKNILIQESDLISKSSNNPISHFFSPKSNLTKINQNLNKNHSQPSLIQQSKNQKTSNFFQNDSYNPEFSFRDQPNLPLKTEQPYQNNQNQNLNQKDKNQTQFSIPSIQSPKQTLSNKNVKQNFSFNNINSNSSRKSLLKQFQQNSKDELNEEQEQQNLILSNNIQQQTSQAIIEQMEEEQLRSQLKLNNQEEQEEDESDDEELNKYLKLKKMSQQNSIYEGQTPSKKKKIVPAKYLDTPFLLENFKEQYKNQILNDKNLRNLMLFYGQENQFFIFLNKLFKLCISILNSEAVIERDLPRINISNIFKDQFIGICDKVLQSNEMPQNKIKEFKKIFNLEWKKIISQVTLIQEIGGIEQVQMLNKKFITNIAKFYNFKPDKYFQMSLTMFQAGLDQSKEDNLIQLEVGLNQLRQLIQSLYTIMNEDIFHFKRILWESMGQLIFLSLETKIKIIQNLDKMRYPLMKEVYSLQSLDQEILENILFFFIKNKRALLKYFPDQVQKEDIANLCNLLIQTIFGYQSLRYFAQFLKEFCSKQPDKLCLEMIHNCLKDAVKKFGSIHVGVQSEIDIKFFWIKVYIGVKSDYDWLFSQLEYFLEKLKIWTDKMIENNQIPSDVKPEQFAKQDLLYFFLQTALTGSISIHDIKPALQFYKIQPKAMEIWIKGIKRTLFVHMKLPSEQVIDTYNYLIETFKKGAYL